MFQAFKKLIIVACLLTALAYIGNLLIDNPYVHSLLRNMLNQKLEQYTNLAVKFEAINVKFVPLGLDVYGIEVRYKGPAGGDETLTQLSHLRLRLSLLALTLNRAEIFDLEMNELRVSLPMPPLEELLKTEQFPDWNKKSGLPSWPLKLPMPFRHIKIGDATLNVKWPDTKPQAPDLLSMQLEGLNVDFTFRNWQKLELALQVKRGNFRLQGADLLRDFQLQLKLNQDKDQISSEIFKLESEELRTSGALRAVYETEQKKDAGPLQGAYSRQLKGLLFSITNDIDQADIGILGRYLEIGDTAGPLSGQTEMQLHIPLDDRTLSWRLDGKAQARSATLSGFKLLDSKLDFNITDEGVSFEKVQVLQGKRPLMAGSGFIGFKDEIPFHFDLQTKGLPFSDLMSVLKMDGFNAFRAELISPSLKLQGTALPFAMDVRGPARFSQISLPFVDSLPKRFPDEPTCFFQTDLHINADAVEINKGDGQCWKSVDRAAELPTDGGNPVKLGGKFFYETDKGMDFDISAPGLDASILEHFAKLPTHGLINLQTHVRGPYDHLTIGGMALAQNLTVGGFDFKQLQTNYQLKIDSNELELGALRAVLNEQGSLELDSFHLELGGLYPFKTRVKAQGIPSQFLAEGLKQTFQLDGFQLTLPSIQGTLQGPLLQPFAWRGRLDFTVTEFLLKDERMLSEASGSIQSDERFWTLTQGYARLDQLEVETSARIQRSRGPAKGSGFWQELGIGPNDRVHLILKTIDQSQSSYRPMASNATINHLINLPYIGSFFRTQKFSAQVQLDVELEGPIDKLQGKLEGSLDQASVWDIPISSFTFAGFVDGWQLHIPELRHSGNALVGRFNIDFGQPSLPYDWYLYFNQLDIRAACGKIFADDPRNFAYLSAEWTMRGKLNDFWKSEGEILLSRIRSKFFRSLGSRTSSVELNSDDPIKVRISAEGWNFSDNRPLKLTGEYFDLSFAAGNNRLPDQLDFSVSGSVKLDLLKNFSNVIETARGEIVVDGYLRGSIDKPELSIKLKEKRLDPFNMKDWQPLSVGLVDYGPALNSITMDVEIKDDRMIVNTFKAGKGREGSLSMSGELRFDGSSNDNSRLSIDLDRLEFNRLAIPILKSADLTLSGSLVVTGHQLPLNLSGDLVINRLQSIGNFDLRKQIISSLYETKIHSTNLAATQAPLLNLNIGLAAEQSITIRNKSLEAVISANLHVRGTDTQPVLLGQVIADRGTFNYRRNFKINQAVISFDEPSSPPNPRLDIVGEATVSPYQVQVVVNGNLQAPRIQLTVDPPNRDDGSPISNLDILLLISTGRIPEQANKTTAERASLNELVSFFAAFAEEPIEKLFDMSGQTVIREVYFDSYLPESGQRPITRINFPIRLGEKINAVLQVDDEANTKVSLEYLIHEGVTVSGSLDQNSSKQANEQKALPADSGFDLKFRFGFD